MFRGRRACALLAILLCGSLPGRAADDTAGAGATVTSLCNSLVAAMKQGSSMTFAARDEKLSPEIRQDFDLALMSRIIVGPQWKQLGDTDRQSMVGAFSDYSVANYAQRFKSYSGERFVVDPVITPMANGDCVVHTKLYTSDPNPVQLDYLMRLSDGRWRIFDVFLSGTISELAARRSEYSLVLRTGGVPALVDLLRKKTAELAN
jgi:phospholipid transport system substrate-binding protein